MTQKQYARQITDIYVFVLKVVEQVNIKFDLHLLFVVAAVPEFKSRTGTRNL